LLDRHRHSLTRFQPSDGKYVTEHGTQISTEM
jgi:hypothetical protein